MWELIRGITPEQWQWFGTFITSMIIGTVIAVRSVKTEPTALGVKPPPTDMTQYLLADVRSLSRKMEVLIERVDEMHDENAELLHNVYRDTQVIRDRGRRE